MFEKESWTNPQEHPASRKSYLSDRVWLLRRSTVLALEFHERYRLCAWTILETDHGPLDIGRLEGPRLRQVCQVH
jgi:hypothetical protein